MATLEESIAAGKAQGKQALYFGYWSNGHFLHHKGGATIYDAERDIPGFPWSEALMDCGLLMNGKRPEPPDGKVYWTCCGGLAFWYAFFWWDRSGDKRGKSNSGFYVRGFGWPEAQAAFDYACIQFPQIVARQRHPLILQL